MVLDADRVIGQFEDFGVGHAKPSARLRRRRLVAGAGVAAAAPEDEAHILGPERAAQHRAMALAEGRFVDVKLVGIDLALDDVFAETIRSGDEDDVAEAGFGVERKDHAARRPGRSAPSS